MDDHHSALTLAREFDDHVQRGETALAEQTRTTIEDLVGSFVDGRLVLPADVALTMWPRWEQREFRARATGRQP